MCGIAGEVRFDDQRPDLAALEQATQSMDRRGPDACGLQAQGHVAFGHRRLKIIDLTDAAQQPLVDSELGLTVVFNGCIYNHRELRGELEGKGYRFFSTGDTEVIVKAYHAWGEDFVHRLNGMFAFAIAERDTGRVLIGRDRLGIKPLYYAETPGAIRFASTLQALLAYKDVDRSLDPDALNFYFTFHAVVPAPWTMMRGVRKLPPATLMRIEPDGRRTTRQYWDVSFGPRDDERGYTRADWKAVVAQSLRLAVKRRLCSEADARAVNVIYAGRAMVPVDPDVFWRQRDSRTPHRSAVCAIGPAQDLMTPVHACHRRRLSQGMSRPPARYAEPVGLLSRSRWIHISCSPSPRKSATVPVPSCPRTLPPW